MCYNLNMNNVSDINEMKCFVFRLAQKRWNVEPEKCAKIFDENKLYEMIEKGYDYLHLSSYDNVVSEMEIILKNRGCHI